MKAVIIFFTGLVLGIDHFHKIPYSIDYTYSEVYNNHSLVVNECPLGRTLPRLKLTFNTVSFPLDGCKNGEEDAECPEGNKCYKMRRIPGNILRDDATLSLGLNYSCPLQNNVFIHELVQWGHLRLSILCQQQNRPAIACCQMNTEEHVLSYNATLESRQGVLHMMIKLNESLPAQVEVYVNGEKLSPVEHDGRHESKTTHDYTSIYFGPRSSLDTSEPLAWTLIAADILKSENISLQVLDEYQYMELLAGGVPYPECLCPPDTGVEGTDLCSDGTGRLTQEPDQYFLPVTGLHDGIWNSSLQQGTCWAAPRYKLMLSLTFSKPALITKLEVHLAKQSFTIYKQDFEEQNAVLRISLNDTDAQSYNPRWEASAADFTEDRFIWDLAGGNDSLVASSLHFAFNGNRLVNYYNYPAMLKEYNLLCELVLYGREIDNPDEADRCSCFLGNEQGAARCDKCKKCMCRDGHTSRHGNTCAPYITSVEPNFGPVSGGTRLTIRGGLLQPRIKAIPTSVVVHIGHDGTCQNNGGHPHKDGFIWCWTSPSNRVVEPLPVWVDLLLDGVQYRIDQELTFTYMPDPIIEDVTPYRAYLSGGSNLTIRGQNLKSVTFHGSKDVLILGDRDARGDCFIRSSKLMVCTLPTVRGSSTIETSIGLELDGVLKYRNLSHTFPNQTFYIFPKPSLRSDDVEFSERKLTLRGTNLDDCCSEGNYTVLLDGKQCMTTALERESLSCDPGNTTFAGTRHHIVVRVDSFKIDLGYVVLSAQTESNLSHIISAIGCTALILVILFLCLGIIFCKWRKKNGVEEIPPIPLTNLESTSQCLGMDDKKPGTEEIIASLNKTLQKVIRSRLLKCENIEKHRRIGKGNFGKVFHATITVGAEVISAALKTLKDGTSSDKEDIEEFLTEATVMKDFFHPNVLCLIGVILTDLDIFVVLPYMVNGDLRKYAARQMFDFKTFHQFTLDVANGMKYLATKRFVHRDLAARNCMVNAEGVVLIGDFGLAKDIYVADYYRPEGRNKPMPFKWMAPECLDERVFTTKSDVWAYGITMWETYTQGDRPYPMVENLDLLMYLMRGNRLEKPDNCPEPIFQIMTACWQHDPDVRPTFAELVDLLNDAAKMIHAATKTGGPICSTGVGKQTSVVSVPSICKKPENTVALGTSESQCPLLDSDWDMQEDDMPDYLAPVPPEEECEGAVGGAPAHTTGQAISSQDLAAIAAAMREGSSPEDDAGYLKPVSTILQPQMLNMSRHVPGNTHNVSSQDLAATVAAMRDGSSPEDDAGYLKPVSTRLQPPILTKPRRFPEI